ncbi:MAG: sigma-54-dependent Fis family transcriptional regulator [Candidatus Latescibacteria bacterium]|nr:sigma-54-dependent Fis family transcriptional regulator [Candidatus Latescibacterota bacterium]
MAESAVELKGSRILVVDDTPANLKLMSRAMAGAGYEAMVASSGEVALQLAERFVPDLVLLDVTMPGLDGFEVCRRLKQHETTRAIPVIFLTARDDTADLVEGFRAGGVDYVTKPFQKEEVLVRIQTHLEKAALVRALAEKNAALEDHARQLAEKNRALEEEMARRETLTKERDALAGRLEDLSQQQIAQQGGSLVGQSLAVTAMLEEIALLQQAHTVSVLITGESGTGKEVVARAVHYGGSRARGPFVAVNCPAIPRELAESSFFGHLRGAFTGAHEARRGYFEQADGGTLFLDEIGDLPLELQAKLLRTLETGRVTPLGSSQERVVDVRILAATNQELTTLIAQDRFREDLYFRLAGFTVAVPPLRNRREDLPLLVDHFLGRYGAEMGREPAGMSREALAMLEGHEFPGNVRELKNLVEYALIRSRGALVRPEHLRFVEFRPGAEPARAPAPPPASVAGHPANDEEQILAYVRQHGSIGNTECRDLLAVSPERASYLLKKLNAQGLLEQEGARRWSRYRLPLGSA